MVGSMGTTIGTHRLRRWPNIKPSLIQYLMFAWYRTYKNKTINSSAANDAYYSVRIKFCNLFVSGSSGGGGGERRRRRSNIKTTCLVFTDFIVRIPYFSHSKDSHQIYKMLFLHQKTCIAIILLIFQVIDLLCKRLLW